MTAIVSAAQIAQGDLHAAMLEAYSDYAVPMRLSRARFDEMLQQRSVDLSASRVALAGGDVAAIWLVGRRGERGYLISCGTRPGFRARGLARALAEDNLAALRKAGVRVFQAEVLRNNDSALALYLSLGMHIHRALDCYSLPEAVQPASGPTRCQPVRWEEIAAQAAALLDWAPSWQNEAPSLAAISDQLPCLARMEGASLGAFAAVQRSTGTIQQIAVQPDLRRRGIARGMIAELQARLPGMPLRFINLCAGDAGFRAFAASMGAAEMVGQYELTLRL